MLNKNKLLSHLNDYEERVTMGHLLDLVEQVQKNHCQVNTPFYDPTCLELADKILRGIDNINFSLDGGYYYSERKTIVIYPEYLDEAYLTPYLQIISFTGNDYFSSLKHPDFLGAVMALGLKRAVFGDIVVGDKEAYLVASEKISDFISRNLTHIGKVKIKVELKERADLEKCAAGNFTEKQITVSSLRLDAVGSQGFNLSRTKMVELIKSGTVKCNFRIITEPDYAITAGDLISCRRKGRLYVNEIKGTTKKGRISVELKLPK